MSLRDQLRLAGYREGDDFEVAWIEYPAPEGRDPRTVGDAYHLNGSGDVERAEQWAADYNASGNLYLRTNRLTDRPEYNLGRVAGVAHCQEMHVLLLDVDPPKTDEDPSGAGADHPSTRPLQR